MYCSLNLAIIYLWFIERCMSVTQIIERRVLRYVENVEGEQIGKWSWCSEDLKLSLNMKVRRGSAGTAILIFDLGTDGDEWSTSRLGRSALGSTQPLTEISTKVFPWG
jgi:hypothetical protein